MSTPSSLSESQQLAAISHVVGIVFGFAGPLVIWLWQRGKDPFVAAHAREALNFQITVAGALIANAILNWLVIVWWIVGWAVPLALFVVVVWWSILGFQAASAGRDYRYPFAFRIVG